jgi:hypothetical protein
VRIVTSILFLALCPAWAQVRLNDIQVIGSHNSYHVGLAPSAAALTAKRNPTAAAAWNYRHPPLDEQLSAGVRQLEIDVYADPQGGLFADPAGPHALVKEGFPPDPPFDPEGILKKPGFKVIHYRDYDYRSSCQPFTACLATVRNWSKSHPGHLPIFLLIENKDEKTDAALFDALDAEIRSVFQPSEMIAPDDVRSGRETLEEAVLQGGWPLLASSRGKVIFLMDQSRCTAVYTQGHPSLRGRAMFTNSVPGTPDAAFVEVNDSVTDPQRVPQLVKKGYLVRTRTDAELKLSTVKRDAAMASGAQLLSTDFPFDERAGSGYSVRFEQGIARCNPLRKCDPAALREESK